MPYVEPLPADDAAGVHSASARMTELDTPLDERRGSPAKADVVRWTDAAEGY
jgi:hypothetical protein